VPLGSVATAARRVSRATSLAKRSSAPGRRVPRVWQTRPPARAVLQQAWEESGPAVLAEEAAGQRLAWRGSAVKLLEEVTAQ